MPLSKSTDEYEKNIKISLQNIGTWNQWGKITNNSSSSIKINCFYGTTTNGFICNDNDCPSDTGNGIQYIFRPINLTDMFPNNRNPRFNWTGTINKSTNKATGAAILKENSYYIKKLNRNKNEFENFSNFVKDKYGLRVTDRISKTIDNIDLISTLLNTLK